jgi:acetyltransferase-like isoleucine patch superfamily enzyme
MTLPEKFVISGGFAKRLRKNVIPPDMHSDGNGLKIPSDDCSRVIYQGAGRLMMQTADSRTTSVFWKAKIILLAAIAILPSFCKRFIYRFFFGYKIGKRVKIGLTILDAHECAVGDDVRIGHLNLVLGVKKLLIGDHARIGHLNIIRGGAEVRLGRYSEILRLNVINSIPNPILVTSYDPRFFLGDGGVITSEHRIDFTDRVEIGRRSILGGRSSSLWTHNRQSTFPIKVGSLTYLGSEIRVAPGVVIPSRCIIGLGSVVVSDLKEEGLLISGVPARPVRLLSDEEIKRVLEYKTRPDLPDEI